MQNSIEWTSQAIVNACGVRPALIRPPGGNFNDSVRANVPLPLVYWTVDTLDWQTRSMQATVDHVLSRARGGQIILMHDTHSSTAAAAEILIPELISRGYQLVTVSQLLAARGIYLSAGQVIYSANDVR